MNETIQNKQSQISVILSLSDYSIQEKALLLLSYFNKNDYKEKIKYNLATLLIEIFNERQSIETFEETIKNI